MAGLAGDGKAKSRLPFSRTLVNRSLKKIARPGKSRAGFRVTLIRHPNISTVVTKRHDGVKVAH